MGSAMEASLKHAKNIAKFMSHCDSTYIIHIALKELGVASSHEGFVYAKNSVRLLHDNPNAPLKNGVYLAVSVMFSQLDGEDPVEQAIRRAIQKAWANRDEKLWGYYFPVGKPGRSECPSNRDFLMAVVDFVVLWEGCCEEVNYGRK